MLNVRLGDAIVSVIIPNYTIGVKVIAHPGGKRVEIKLRRKVANVSPQAEFASSDSEGYEPYYRVSGEYFVDARGVPPGQKEGSITLLRQQDGYEVFETSDFLARNLLPQAAK